MNMRNHRFSESDRPEEVRRVRPGRIPPQRSGLRIKGTRRRLMPRREGGEGPSPSPPPGP